MEKRTLIALAISFAVLGFYPLVLQKFYPDYYKKDPLKQKVAVTTREKTLLTSNTSQAGSSFIAGDDVSFNDGKLDLKINSKGAGVRQVDFLSFLNQETKRPLRFFSLQNAEGSPTYLRLIGADLPRVSEVPTYQITQDTSSSLAASALLSQDLRVRKRYQWSPEGYSSNLMVEFENISGQAVEFQYQLFAGMSVPPRHSIDGQYIETDFYGLKNEKPELRHLKETKAGKTVPSVGAVTWVAVKDRHFSVIVEPKGGKTFTGLVEGLGNRQFRASLLSEKISVPAHSSVSQEFLVYIGPNDLDHLLPLGLDPLVNFGKLDPIGKLLVGALEMVHKVVKNYGLSIIVLTALINLLLFPLTRASYMSMKRMQLVQPQMSKLREQNKKNPEKLNREMMELYKKHKVNPFGGCLPMVLQMPVFIALYVALSKSVILIGASFLWVKDLSSPDSLPLPFTFPLLENEIHVLPLIMAGAMLVQQRFTQIKMEGQDPAMEAQQKMMAVMMPVIFCFIFYSMPSGLVLYWLTNTLLMTTYQLRLKNMTLA